MLIRESAKAAARKTCLLIYFYRIVHTEDWHSIYFITSCKAISGKTVWVYMSSSALPITLRLPPCFPLMALFV